jgi:RNA polymerase primary sigma factor
MRTGSGIFAAGEVQGEAHGVKASDSAADLDDDALRAYLRALPAQPALSAAEEQQLFARLAGARQARERLAAAPLSPAEQAPLRTAIAAAEEARQRLILSHLPLVVALARPYAGRGAPLLDLIQEGNLGLVQAIERFDPQRGVRLASYAAPWIRHAILRALADYRSAIRLPRQVRNTLARLSRAHADLAQQLGREPAAHEVAAHLVLRDWQVVEGLTVLRPPLALDALPAEDGELALADTLADPQAVDAEELVAGALLQDIVHAALAALAPQEREVLVLRYGLADGRCHSVAEVSSATGLRRDQVRRLEGRALRKLRQMPLAGVLADAGDRSA